MMKYPIKTTKKLALHTESLRVLAAADLEAIAGGMPKTKTDLCTNGPCGTR